MVILSAPYRCVKNINGLSDSGIISKCTDKRINVGRIIGDGSFGTIYKAKYISDDGKITYVAVKKIMADIKNLDSRKLKHVINDITIEVEYNYYVSKRGISPVIYDSFFTTNNNTLVCYIIMEIYDKSVEKTYYEKLTVKDYIFIHTQMIKLMNIQIFKLNMFCTDIKPENFVIKSKSGNFSVKAIENSLAVVL